MADQLEKQRDIRRETAHLQSQGVGRAEAEALATERITAAIAARNAKEAERPRRREREEEPHRRGQRETFTIHGYSDPDKGGGLHTGSLSTGNLGSGGTSSAAAALASAPTAAGALAAAPAYVPTTFPTAARSMAPAFATSFEGAAGAVSDQIAAGNPAFDSPSHFGVAADDRQHGASAALKAAAAAVLETHGKNATADRAMIQAIQELTAAIRSKSPDDKARLEILEKLVRELQAQIQNGRS